MTGKLGEYIAIIIIAGFLIYAQTLFFGFTYFDDNVLILNNISFLKDIGNIFAAFGRDVFRAFSTSAFYYRPLLTVSFILDAQLSGIWPFFYHLSNVLYHLIASVLVFIILVKLNYKKELAFIAGLIFVVHPVLTQAVVWIPGRNDSLVTIFILFSFIFFLKFLESKKWEDYLFHLAFFLLATLTKENAIFLPVVCLVYSLRGWKSLVLGWAGVVTMWFLLRINALRNVVPTDLPFLAKSVVHNLPAIFLYFGKVFAPFNLSVLPTLIDSSLVFGLVSSLAVLLAFVFSERKNLRLPFFGLVWFLIFLLPNFVYPNEATVPYFLEQRIYLPFLGLFVIFGEIDLVRNLDFNKKTVKASVAFLVLVLGIVTIIYSRNFKDRIYFWASAVNTSPHHPLAHRNLGAMYYLDGRLDEAKVEFEKSLVLNPNEQMAHNNLGLIYMNKGDYKRAEEEYKKELVVNPYYDTLYFNWGILFYKEGKLDAARAMWIKTLEINPDYQDAANYVKLLQK